MRPPRPARKRPAGQPKRRRHGRGLSELAQPLVDAIGKVGNPVSEALMYLAVIILLMGAFPAISVLIEFCILHSSADPLFLIGKWFVFWGVGVRLMLAGFRQIANPTFTADVIFGVKEKAALTIVQELGFGNLSIGLLGALALVKTEWIVPAAIIGGLFYGLAGVKHLIKGDRNATETIAMVSDLFIFLVLVGYLAGLMLRPA